MNWTAWKRPLFILLVLASTGISYLHVLEAGFVWDDYLYVVENTTLHDLDGLRLIWLDPRANSQYYPLVYTSFWVEYQLWQLTAVGYHVANVILHAVNALLVWVLLRRLSLPGAWLAALLFALHPTHVESVAWVSERKNVLSGLFYLAAALSYLRFRGLAAEPRSQARRFYGLSLLLFVCALLSKSVTASLPAAILLVVYWKTGRARPRDWVLMLPFFAAGIAAGVHTAWLERVHVGASGADWDLSLLERMLIASRALCHYVAKLVWPEPLMFSYPRWTIDASVWWQYLFGLALCGALFAAWRGRHSHRGPLVALLFFAGTLVPALGFVDIYPMRFSFVADHFQYLASLGVIVPVAAGVATAGRRLESAGYGAVRWIGLASIGIVVAVLASLTLAQTRIYRDEEILWRDTLAKNPTSWMAHNNLGQLYGSRGDYESALQHFQRAIELNPSDYLAETNVAEALNRLGRYEEAEVHLRHVIEVEPALADAHFVLWVALRQLGRLDEAVEHLQRETALTQTFEAHFRAAQLLGAAGRPRDALLEVASAAKFRPRDPAVAVARGNLQMALGDTQQALAAYREALTLEPNWLPAHINLGRAFERMGDVASAEQAYSRAANIDPDHPGARANLDRLRAGRSSHSTGSTR